MSLGHSTATPSLVPAAGSVPPTEASGKHIFRVCYLSTVEAILTVVVSSQIKPEAHTTEPSPGWPLDTDLIITPGTKNKVLLTAQRYLPRLVMHGALEYIRASLLFIHAYPGQDQAATFVRDALITAAYARGAEALTLHKRLVCDDTWVNYATPLVSNLVLLDSAWRSHR